MHDYIVFQVSDINGDRVKVKIPTILNGTGRDEFGTHYGSMFINGILYALVATRKPSTDVEDIGVVSVDGVLLDDESQEFSLVPSRTGARLEGEFFDDANRQLEQMNELASSLGFPILAEEEEPDVSSEQ